MTRPAYPPAAATAATAPAASSTARRLGSVVAARSVVMGGRRQRPPGLQPGQGPQHSETDETGDEHRDGVRGVDDRPAQDGVQRDADQSSQEQGAPAERPLGEETRDGGEHEHAEQYRPDEDRLVVGPEVGDRPVLDRGRGVVDHQLTDREHRRRGRLGERGHEVTDAGPGEGREHAVQGEAELGRHTGWFVTEARRDGVSA